MALPSTNPAVLVVDDDELLCKAVGVLLARMGYRTFTAGTVEAALPLLRTETLDVMLLDLQLPDRDGLALLRELRQQERPLPVVLMSGRGSMDDVIEGMRGGVVDYLRKPFQPEQLSAALDRAMQRQKELSPPPAPDAALPATTRARLEELVKQKGLSPRERQVFELVLLGRTAADIGAVLGITARTAKFHVANLLAKLGAESRADLLRVLL